MSTYELWVIKKCKCRFISFNKFNTLLNDIDNRGGYGCRKVGSIWEIYNFLLNLFGNLNALLGFPDGASDKEPVCQYRRHREAGLVLGSGRTPGRGHNNPLQHFCLENPMDRGAWWATVHGVAKSQTRLSG